MRKALQRGSDTHSLDDIVGCLQRGEMQLFQNERAVIVTSIVQAPQKRYVEFFISAGDLDALMDLYPQVQAWALKQGADFGRAFVRKGLVPIFEQRGWKAKSVLMEYHPEGG